MYVPCERLGQYALSYGEWAKTARTPASLTSSRGTAEVKVLDTLLNIGHVGGGGTLGT